MEKPEFTYDEEGSTLRVGLSKTPETPGEVGDVLESVSNLVGSGISRVEISAGGGVIFRAKTDPLDLLLEVPSAMARDIRSQSPEFVRSMVWRWIAAPDEVKAQITAFHEAGIVSRVAAEIAKRVDGTPTPDEVKDMVEYSPCPSCGLYEEGSGECPAVIEDKRMVCESLSLGEAWCPCCDDCRSTCVSDMADLAVPQDEEDEETECP